jgi:hypothetical protein
VIDKKNGLDVDLNNVSAEQFDEAMARTYIPANMRTDLRGFMVRSVEQGIWGTCVGGASLAAFGYKVSQGAWDADTTAMERFGAARDLITFTSASTAHSSKSIATIIDTFFAAGRDPTSPTAFQAMGLDRTLPELYGVNSFLPNNATWSGAWGAVWDAYDSVNSTSTSATRYLQEFANESEVGQFVDITNSSNSGSTVTQVSDDAVETIADIFAKKEPLVPASIRTKVAGTLLKVLGTVNDTFGFADLVTGSIAAKQYAEANDRPMAIASSLSAVAGALQGIGSTVYVASWIAPLSPTIAGMASPFILASTLLAVSALVIMVSISIHRKNENRQDNVEDQSAFFQRLSDQGLMQDDWGDKLAFLRNAWSAYGNDNPNEDQSYFDYQRAEWEHFNATPPQRGSSKNRLDSDLHIHNELTVDGMDRTQSDWE